MKIIEFNRAQGFYSFEIDKITTDLHAHPAVEILYSKYGKIRILTTNEHYENLSFAIIDANFPHQVFAEDNDMVLMMFEGRLDFLSDMLSEFDIILKDGIYTEKKLKNKNEFLNSIANLLKKEKIQLTKDARVNNCLEYLNSDLSNYLDMISVLKGKTFLSESRLSHLFKQEIGLSLKKYLVWCKLKKAFELVVSRKMNMFEASIESGFYDQAHLSKAFKQMFGLRPSDSYNSRTLQN